MKLIQENIAYLACLIFAGIGFLLSWLLNDAWAFIGACGLDIIVVIFDYYKFQVRCEHEKMERNQD